MSRYRAVIEFEGKHHVLNKDCFISFTDGIHTSDHFGAQVTAVEKLPEPVRVATPEEVVAALRMDGWVGMYRSKHPDIPRWYTVTDVAELRRIQSCGYDVLWLVDPDAAEGE